MGRENFAMIPEKHMLGERAPHSVIRKGWFVKTNGDDEIVPSTVQKFYFMRLHIFSFDDRTGVAYSPIWVPLVLTFNLIVFSILGWMLGVTIFIG